MSIRSTTGPAGAALAGILALFQACSLEQPVEPTAEQQVQASSQQLLQFFEFGFSSDSEFARISRRVRSFAGIYIDSSGAVRVLVADEQDNAVAVVEARSVVARRQLGGATDTRLQTAAYSVERVRWSFADLSATYSRIASLLGSPDVVYSDIDEKHNVVAIAFATESAQLRASQWVQDNGLSAEPVELRVEPVTRQSTDLRDRIRPVLPGTRSAYPLAEGSYAHCTVGFIVVYKSKQRSIVNSHCTTVQGALDGQFQYQSSFLENHKYGSEYRDPNFVMLPGCPANRLCRYSDAAVITPLPQEQLAFGQIARTSVGSTNVLSPPYAVIGRLYGPVLTGEIVYKVGQSTGTSVGTVIDTPATQDIYDPYGNPTGWTLLNQVRVQATVDAGDSGSPVFATYCDPLFPCTYNAIVYGILWGRQSGSIYTFSPIGNIELDLGNSLTVY